MDAHYAHSLPGRPTSEWEPLEEHLTRVAELARQFARRFDAAEWGYLAGLWHDMGKYRPEDG
jgi:HD superfamily phosphohydrolase YqeK